DRHAQAKHPASELLEGTGHESKSSGRPTHPWRAGPAPHLMVRWDKLDAFVCLDHLPSTYMNQAVVVVAEGKEFAQVGRTTVRPELDVVRLGPVDRPIAA